MILVVVTNNFVVVTNNFRVVTNKRTMASANKCFGERNLMGIVLAGIMKYFA
jgi:hypothetical protein